jgi:hypothetical protein
MNNDDITATITVSEQTATVTVSAQVTLPHNATLTEDGCGVVIGKHTYSFWLSIEEDENADLNDHQLQERGMSITYLDRDIDLDEAVS